MRFEDMFLRDAIIPELRATNCNDAITEMLRAACDAGAFPEEFLETASDAVLTRERLGSTVLEKNRFFPHARVEGLPRMFYALAISRRGFVGNNGKKVYISILFLYPPNQPAEGLQGLLDITKRISGTLLADLLEAESCDEIWELLVANDALFFDKRVEIGGQVICA